MAFNMKKELRAAFAEFIGTALFVFFGAGSVCASIRNGNAANVGDYALSFGFTITALAFAIGDVSGGHMNPAVTLMMVITQEDFTLMRGLRYMLAQFLGGILGGGLLCAATGGFDEVHNGKQTYFSGIGINGGNLFRINSGEAFLFEFMGTLILLFVVINTAHWVSNAPKSDLQSTTFGALAPIPIGLTVAVSHLVLGPYTGCGINPARVLGAVVWEADFFDNGMNGDGKGKDYFWVYFVGPWMASVAAPMLYWALYGSLKPGSVISSENGSTKVAAGSA